jgi:hypothetical protein
METLFRLHPDGSSDRAENTSTQGTIGQEVQISADHLRISYCKGIGRSYTTALSGEKGTNKRPKPVHNLDSVSTGPLLAGSSLEGLKPCKPISMTTNVIVLARSMIEP